MHDYFSDALLVATVKIDGNVARSIGEAVAAFHAEKSRKIAYFEETKPAGWRFMVAIIKTEIASMEELMRDVEKGIRAARNSETVFQEEFQGPEEKRRVA